jgi:hypothetical protein
VDAPERILGFLFAIFRHHVSSFPALHLSHGCDFHGTGTPGQIGAFASHGLSNARFLNMRKMLSLMAVAGLMAFGSGAASAQSFEVRIGDPGPRHRVVERRIVRDYDRPVVRRRVVERRRIVRPRTRTVCRTVIRERVRANGVVVRRPTEVCRQQVVGRRVYVD